METIDIKQALCKHALLVVLTGESNNAALTYYLTGYGEITPEQDIRFEYKFDNGRQFALENLTYTSIFNGLIHDRAFETVSKDAKRHYYTALMYLLYKMNYITVIITINNGELSYKIDIDKFKQFADTLTDEQLTDLQTFLLHVNREYNYV